MLKSILLFELVSNWRPLKVFLLQIYPSYHESFSCHRDLHLGEKIHQWDKFNSIFFSLTPTDCFSPELSITCSVFITEWSCTITGGRTWSWTITNVCCVSCETRCQLRSPRKTMRCGWKHRGKKLRLWTHEPGEKDCLIGGFFFTWMKILTTRFNNAQIICNSSDNMKTCSQSRTQNSLMRVEGVLGDSRFYSRSSGGKEKRQRFWFYSRCFRGSKERVLCSEEVSLVRRICCLFSVKFNLIFKFWTKQNIWSCQPGLWEVVIDSVSSILYEIIFAVKCSISHNGPAVGLTYRPGGLGF